MAGDHDIYSTEGWEQTRTVCKRTIHPDYVGMKKGIFGEDQDLALLKTCWPFQLNERVDLIRIAHYGLNIKQFGPPSAITGMWLSLIHI